MWWLTLSYGCLGYVAYVYMSWFYLYLVNARGFTILSGGVFAAAPFLTILISCPLGGWVTDRLAMRHGITKGRQIVGMTGMGLAASSIVLGASVESPYLAIAGLSLGAGWLYFTIGAYLVFDKRSVTDPCRVACQVYEDGRQSRRRPFAYDHTMARSPVGMARFARLCRDHGPYRWNHVARHHPR